MNQNEDKSVGQAKPGGLPTLLKRAAMFAIPAAIGIAILAMQVTGKRAPERDLPRELARDVRVITATPTKLVPRVTGFGVVEPATVWQGVAQVEGRVVHRHSNLELGALIEAGTDLIRIDPTDFRLARDRAEANLAAVAAQLAQLDVRDSNLNALLEVERQSLALFNRDVTRQQRLAKRGTVSQARLDETRRAALSQRLKVVDLDNQLATVTVERRELEASRALREAEKAQAVLDLERTTITMPFTGRIAVVAAELAQYVRKGDQVVAADSIDRAEIKVQVPIGRFRPLIPSDLSLVGLSDTKLSQIFKKLRLTATVAIVQPGLTAIWEARVDRIAEEIDPETRSLGVYVTVDDPYRKAIPGKRPPLAKNQFARVEIAGPARPDRIVVPRATVRRGADDRATVYLADTDNRLRRAVVSVSAEIGDLAVISDGISPDDRVIVSDVIPAVEGMLLATVEDEAARQRLLARASGAVPLP